MSQQDLDPVTETLNKVLGPEDVALVTRGAVAMRNRIGTLSDSDVDRIAAAVADKMMASAQMQSVKAPEEKAQLRAKVYDVAYQLVLSVAGSGLFALLAYFADVISFSFSKEGDAGDPEKAAAREDILTSVDPEDRAALRKALDPALPQLIGMEMFKRVRQHDELLALGSAAVEARSDPVTGHQAPLSRGWIKRLLGRSKPADAIVSAPSEADLDRAAHDQADALTKFIWFGLLDEARSRRRGSAGAA